LLLSGGRSASCCSLKNFKSINTQYGQRDGDQILREIAGFISQMEARAMAYRIQGVEFAIVVSRMGREEYERCFRR
jgi:diguanylate cyclase (GGDEF)-like protein